jgi:hypothetical protein
LSALAVRTVAVMARSLPIRFRRWGSGGIFDYFGTVCCASDSAVRNTDARERAIGKILFFECCA